jgi:serine phosphatase RsbU (regulator of sigma subunit)/anti-sigma regulatory factor (Ser/Thr protein kinase)
VNRAQLRRDVITAVVVAVAYAAGSVTAYLLFNAFEAGAVFFPPAGVTLAALILTGYRTWPWVLGAAGITELVIDLVQGHDPSYAWGFVLANLAEPLVGAWLIRMSVKRTASRLDVSRSSGLGAFLAGGVLVGPLVGGAIGAATLAWGMGRDYADAFGPFWAGDGLGALTVGGAILAWHGSRVTWTGPDVVRLVQALLLTAVVTAVGFWPMDVPLAYLVIPLLFFFAVRGGVPMVAAAGVVVALTANTVTAAGRGPWQGLADSPRLEIATLQVFLAVVVLSAWLFAIEVAERDRAQASWRQEQSARTQLQAQYKVEQQAAHLLQQALLPSVELEFPGVRAAVRYRPAELHHDVGGDWYDVFDLPGGRVGFSVGDVVGHDLAAAAAMGRLQSVLRAAAWSSSGPAQVLEELDRAGRSIPGADFATVGYGEFSPADGVLRYACAGHPPPLLVTSQDPTYLLGGRSQPLCYATGPRPQAELLLPGESTVVWYSDGLVENRRQSLDDGLGQLSLMTADLPTGTAEAWCDAVLSGMTRGRSIEDDIVVIVLQLRLTGHSRGEPADNGTLSMRVVEPADLAVGRRLVRDWADRQQIGPAVLEPLLLVCSEAMTNAVEHAYQGCPPGPVDLVIDRPDPAHLRVRVSDTGHWQHDRESTARGRGLELINQLASSTTLDLTPTGTTVTIWLATHYSAPGGRPPDAGADRHLG